MGNQALNIDEGKVYNILTISGPTGVGKTFIKDMLLAANIKSFSKFQEDITFTAPMQITTREKRHDEDVISTNYKFVTDAEFSEALCIGAPITAECTVNDHNYGTLVNTFVPGANNINVIVCNSEGLKHLKEDFCNCKNVNIKTALVLGDPDSDLINEHGRDRSYYEQEIFLLTSIPYDYYIPNYQFGVDDSDRLTTEKLLKILGILKGDKING